MIDVHALKEYIRKYFYLLGQTRKKYIWLLVLFTVSSVFDMLGIGLIAPFIELATRPELVEKYAILKALQINFSS